MNAIQQLTADFVARLTAAVEAHVKAFAIEALNHSTPTQNGTVLRPSTPGHRRKAPLQLCPVPRCRNAAAPVYGMVCAKHKDVPKRQIAKYREARRARKAKAS